MDFLSIREIVNNTISYTNKKKRDYIKLFISIQIFSLCVSMVILKISFNIFLKISNLDNINNSNIITLFKSPESILGLILLFTLAVIVVYLEFSLSVTVIITDQKGISVSIKDIIKLSFKNMKKILGVQLIPLFLYFLLMIPLAGLGLNSLITGSISIPNFIIGSLLKSKAGSILYMVAMILVIYINIRLIFVIPLIIGRNITAFQAVKQSMELTKKKSIFLLLSLFILEVLLAIGSILVILLLFGIIIILENTKILYNSISIGIMLTLIQIVIFFTTILAKVLLLQGLIYILNKNNLLDLEYKSSLLNKNKKLSTLFSISAVIFIVITVIFNVSQISNPDYYIRTKIIAHRGYVARGVENSMTSIKEAAKFKPDYIEIDIMQTKDKEFVVTHDSNLKRLTGKNINVWQHNLNDLTKLTLKQGQFTDKVPSLDEVIVEAKKLGIKLNIEIKYSGNESSDMIDRFIKKLKQYHVEDEFIVQSLSLKYMEEINEKEPEIKVGYIIPIQFGNFGKDNIDFIVIEESSYNKSLVKEAHKNGKEVYVWTVNKEQNIRKYLMDNCDGIITDKLELVEQVKKDLKENTKFTDRVVQLLKQLS